MVAGEIGLRRSIPNVACCRLVHHRREGQGIELEEKRWGISRGTLPFAPRRGIIALRGNPEKRFYLAGFCVVEGSRLRIGGFVIQGSITQPKTKGGGRR